MADSPGTTQPPTGWQRAAPPEELLDIVHWAVRDTPKRSLAGWPIGAALRRQVAAAEQSVAAGARAIADFCAQPAYQAALPFISTNAPVPHTDTSTVAGVAVVNTDPPAVVPLSTSQHEDTQLRWDDDAHPCASGPQCAAAQLPGAPGPLPYYVPEGVRRDQYEAPACCLLCIRADAAAVATVYSRVVQSSSQQLGRAAVALPPFQNLVNCDGGYSERALGITPNQCIFAPISLVGPHTLPVSVDAAGVPFVDQTTLKASFLGHRAQRA